jgi:iron complex outermembrane receptor protein
MKFLTKFKDTGRLYLLVFGISMLLAVKPAWPQEAQSEQVQEQEQDRVEPDIEVVVTADRVETETTKIPAQVTVITAEEIKAKGKDTLVDVLEELSGVSFRTTTGSPSRAEISMRGFGENSHGRVLVLLDGRRLNQPDMASINWLQIPIENIERVEVVHGGNSVLYGDHAVGGVVNIITKTGGTQNTVDAFASGGSFFDNQERLGVTGSIGPFDLVINAEHTGTMGYRDHSALESIGAGFDLGTDISDLVYGSFKLSYEWLYCELPGYLEKAQMEDDPTQSQALFSDDDVENHTLNSLLGVKALFSDWGELHTDIFYDVKIMREDFPSTFIPGFADPTFTNKILHSFGVSPRMNLNFPIAGLENKLTLGTDLTWDIYNFNRYDDVHRDIKNLEVLINKSSYGGYINNKFSLSETIHLSAGVRYEFAQIASRASYSGDLDGEKLHHAFVWNAGVAWEFLPQSKLYGSYGTLFRYPFIDEQVVYSGYWDDHFNQDLEPETGYNIEVGSLITLFQEILEINFNGFYLVMEDEIAPDFVAEKNVNMDKTERIGGEIGFKVNVLDFMVVSGNYTYTHGIFSAGANAGNFIPFVPEHELYAGVDVNLPLGFSIGSSLHYRGECYSGSDFDNALEKMDDYFLLNGFVKYIPDYIPGKLQIMLQFDNILDELYCTSVYYAFSYYPEPGFNWKITVSYSLEL